MPFVSYASRFPHIGATQYKCVHRMDGDTIVKSILYAELYCDEAGCDCRRVMVHAYDVPTPLDLPYRSAHPHKEAEFLATLNFGWEPLSFYRAWGRGFSEAEIADLKGPGLQPLAPQTDRAQEALDGFLQCLTVPEYVARLQRHYTEMRAFVPGESRKARRARTRGRLRA
jgi:hypothetical protein